MTVRRSGGVVALLALLSGCTVGPDYRKPPLLADTARVPALIEARSPAYAIAPLPADWWKLYGDPRLNALIEKALTRNTDLRSALASLEQSRAQLRETELQRAPSTSLSLNPTYGQGSADEEGVAKALSPAPFYALSESISYDFDLFGRIKRGIEAGRADVGSAQAALDLARVNIAAQTASAYSSICAAGLKIVVTNRSIQIERDNLDVARRRFNAGLTGINDMIQARTQLRQTTADLPALITQQRSGLYMLATLTGDPPEAFPADVVACRLPILRRPIPVGDGAAMLRRRPDVRQSERQLAASVAQIGVSTAALYPSVTLGGSFGTEAATVGHIVQDRAFTWSVGPLLTWGFPNWSIARAQVNASNAAARQALASFDGTILTALRETETALTTLTHDLDAERQLAAARDDAELSRRNVQRLYTGGLDAFLDVLDAERTQTEAETTLANTTAQVSQDQISLFMALGGGWQDAPPVAETPLDAITTPHKKGNCVDCKTPAEAISKP